MIFPGGQVQDAEGLSLNQGTSAIRVWLRACLPLGWRQQWAFFRRHLRDRSAGLCFATQKQAQASRRSPTGHPHAHEDWPHRLSLTQPVMPGALLENKVNNLKTGAAALDGLLIQSGETFSFWHCVGKASVANGYLEGRNIIDGQLRKEVGGGLCQLSSLMYHLALMAGMKIGERHPHSIDLYREEDRFTPLGADATVVWGAKDLRWTNPHRFPVRLSCAYEEGQMVAHLASAGPLIERAIVFEQQSRSVHAGATWVDVITRVDGKPQAHTRYLQKPGMALS